MEQSKIDRINELAHKSKAVGLTDDELAEQKVLRDEFIRDFRANLESQIDNIRIVDEAGNMRKPQKKLVS